MKKSGVAIFFVIMGIMMIIPCIAGAANWTGTWDVKFQDGETMTFILNQIGHKVNGTYSSDLYDGKMSLWRKENLCAGNMTQQDGGSCKIWMEMSPGWNDFIAKQECPSVTNQSSNLRYMKGERK